MVFGERRITIEADYRLTASQVSGRVWIKVRKPGVRVYLPSPRIANAGAIVALANQSDGNVLIECPGRFENGADEFTLESRKLVLLWPCRDGEKNCWVGGGLDGLELGSNEYGTGRDVPVEESVVDKGHETVDKGKSRKRKNG